MPGINALALKKAQATRGLKWWLHAPNGVKLFYNMSLKTTTNLPLVANAGQEKYFSTVSCLKCSKKYPREIQSRGSGVRIFIG